MPEVSKCIEEAIVLIASTKGPPVYGVDESSSEFIVFRDWFDEDAFTVIAGTRIRRSESADYLFQRVDGYIQEEMLRYKNDYVIFGEYGNRWIAYQNDQHTSSTVLYKLVAESPLVSAASIDMPEAVDPGSNWVPVQSNGSSVDHPDHYGGADNPYEAIKVIDAWNLGFSLGNAVKYISRAGKKGDNADEDISKAIWYLNHWLKQNKK